MSGIYECGHASDPVNRDHRSDVISELCCWLSLCGGGDFQAGLGPGAEPSRGFRLLARRGALLAARLKGRQLGVVTPESTGSPCPGREGTR